jgi:hypothetical protein
MLFWWRRQEIKAEYWWEMSRSKPFEGLKKWMMMILLLLLLLQILKCLRIMLYTWKQHTTENTVHWEYDIH